MAGFTTAEKIANQCGVSPQVWRKYENGKVVPSALKMASLHQFAISLDWLLTGDGEMFRPQAEQPKPHYTLRDGQPVAIPRPTTH